MKSTTAGRLTRLGAYARRNVLGLVAVVIASSGTAFAATSTSAFHSIGPGEIAPGAVGSGKLATNSVRGRAVKESTLDPAVLQRRVNGACLVGETIRQINQDGSVLCQVDSTGPLAASGTAGGDLTGTYPNPQVAAGVIGSAEIADGGIAGADVAADTLGGDQIDESRLDRGLLALGGDLTGSVANAQLAAGSVGSSEIADGSIAGADVAGNSLGGAQVDESSLTVGGDLTGTVAGSQIGARTVGSAELGVLPAGRALQTAVQTIDGTTESRVQLDAAQLAQAVTFDDANDQFVVTTPGVYTVTAQVNWKTATGVRVLVLHGGANGAELASDTRDATSGYATLQSVSTVQSFAAGAPIYVGAIQNSGTGLETDIGANGSSPFGASLTLTYDGPLDGTAGRGAAGELTLRLRHLG